MGNEPTKPSDLKSEIGHLRVIIALAAGLIAVAIAMGAGLIASAIEKLHP